MRKMTLEYKEKLKEEGFLNVDYDAAGSEKEKGSHQISLEKQNELDRLKDAFGISDEYEPGKSFDFEAIQEERETKMAERYQQLKDKINTENAEQLLKPPAPWLDRLASRDVSEKKPPSSRKTRERYRSRSRERYRVRHSPSRRRDRSRSRDRSRHRGTSSYKEKRRSRSRS